MKSYSSLNEVHYLKLLENTVKAQWDKPSLCNYNGEQFTYGDVATLVEKFHTVFQNAGFKKGDRMSICARNSARWGISFLAINTYEAVAVPILADFTPDSVAHLTDHSESVVLFVDPDIWKKLNPADMPLLKCAVCATDFTLLYSADESVDNAYKNLNETFQKKFPMGFNRENVSYPDGNGKDLAIINYTSGTTSAPKGVMLKYESMSFTINFCKTNMYATPQDTVVSMLPMAHMYGLAIELLFPCCIGCTIYFLGKTPSPTLLMKAMAEVKPFMVVAVPLVMEKVYKSSIKPAISKPYMKLILHIPFVGGVIYKKIKEKLCVAFGGKVRAFIMGGAALNPEVELCFKRMHLPYTIGYGMTEGCPLLAYEDVDKYVPGSCGKPIQETRIDSEDPAHIAGEILVKGQNITIGYYKNPEANKVSFTPDGFLRTGDLGIIDAKGNLFIRGRSKSMILSSSGQNIYPEEVEAIINNQKYIAECIVVSRSSKLVALVYLDNDSIRRDKMDEESIADIPEQTRINANRNLPSYSQITKVEVMLTPFEKTPKMSIKRFLYK